VINSHWPILSHRDKFESPIGSEIKSTVYLVTFDVQSLPKSEKSWSNQIQFHIRDGIRLLFISSISVLFIIYFILAWRFFAGNYGFTYTDFHPDWHYRSLAELRLPSLPSSSFLFFSHTRQSRPSRTEKQLWQKKQQSNWKPSSYYKLVPQSHILLLCYPLLSFQELRFGDNKNVHRGPSIRLDRTRTHYRTYYGNGWVCSHSNFQWAD